MGSDLQNFLKNCQISHFEGQRQKSLDMGKGFQISGPALRQNKIWVPPSLPSTSIQLVYKPVRHTCYSESVTKPASFILSIIGIR